DREYRRRLVGLAALVPNRDDLVEIVVVEVAQAPGRHRGSPPCRYGRMVTPMSSTGTLAHPRTAVTTHLGNSGGDPVAGALVDVDSLPLPHSVTTVKARSAPTPNTASCVVLVSFV